MLADGYGFMFEPLKKSARKNLTTLCTIVYQKKCSWLRNKETLFLA